MVLLAVVAHTAHVLMRELYEIFTYIISIFVLSLSFVSTSLLATAQLTWAFSFCFPRSGNSNQGDLMHNQKLCISENDVVRVKYCSFLADLYLVIGQIEPNWAHASRTTE